MEKPEYQKMFALERSHWWFVSRRAYIRAICSVCLRTGMGKIADIGAGTGGNIRFLERYGQVIGIEPNAFARTLARKRGIRLRNRKAEHTTLPSQSRDMVCFLDVLYHKNIDDTKALKEAWRVLKPGGMLLITDSAAPWLTGPHDSAVQARERYMLSSITGKIMRAGFRIQKKSYLFFTLFPVFAYVRLFDRMTSARCRGSDVTTVPPFLNTLLIALHGVEARLLRYLSFPWGSSLLILAVKE